MSGSFQATMELAKSTRTILRVTFQPHPTASVSGPDSTGQSRGASCRLNPMCCMVTATLPMSCTLNARMCSTSVGAFKMYLRVGFQGGSIY